LMTVAKYLTRDWIVENLLKPKFPSFQEPCSWFFDVSYYCYDLDDLLAVYHAWRKYLEEFKLKWLPEVTDCDDWAWDFCMVARNTLLDKLKFPVYMGSFKPAIAVGKIYDADGDFLGWHAWNLVLQSGPQPDYPVFLWHLEPQTLDMWPAPFDRSRDGFRYELFFVVW